MTREVYLVTGATGRQGGAVVRHLLAAGARVRALVRNPSAATGQALAQKGIEVVPGDFQHIETLIDSMAGVRSVFGVQPLMLGKTRVEIEWGQRLADAACRSSVEHFVYSSVYGAGEARDVPHFASKAKIEQHIRSIGLSYTILQPAGFMENLLLPVVRKGIAKGKLTAPNSVDAPQHLIAVDDIGAIAARAMTAPENYVRRTIPLVGDVASTRMQAITLSRVLSRTIRPGQLPGAVVWAFLGRDLYRMFRWNDRNSEKLPYSIEALRAEYPHLKSFELWCRETFQERYEAEN